MLMCSRLNLPWLVDGLMQAPRGAAPDPALLCLGIVHRTQQYESLQPSALIRLLPLPMFTLFGDCADTIDFRAYLSFVKDCALLTGESSFAKRRCLALRHSASLL